MPDRTSSSTWARVGGSASRRTVTRPSRTVRDSVPREPSASTATAEGERGRVDLDRDRVGVAGADDVDGQLALGVGGHGHPHLETAVVDEHRAPVAGDDHRDRGHRDGVDPLRPDGQGDQREPVASDPALDLDRRPDALAGADPQATALEDGAPGQQAFDVEALGGRLLQQVHESLRGPEGAGVGQALDRPGVEGARHLVPALRRDGHRARRRIERADALQLRRR